MRPDVRPAPDQAPGFVPFAEEHLMPLPASANGIGSLRVHTAGAQESRAAHPPLNRTQT